MSPVLGQVQEPVPCSGRFTRSPYALIQPMCLAGTPPLRRRASITIHNSPSTYKSVVTNSGTANDRAICSKRCTLPHNRRAIFILTTYSGTWVIHIGKNHARPTKDIVLQGDVVVHRNIVLNFDVVSNPNLIPNKYVLAKRAALANDNGADMYPVPDSASCTNGCSFVD